MMIDCNAVTGPDPWLAHGTNFQGCVLILSTVSLGGDGRVPLLGHEPPVGNRDALC